jgi:hypothetical protein
MFMAELPGTRPYPSSSPIRDRCKMSLLLGIGDQWNGNRVTVLLRVDHRDAKERAYHHRKAVVAQAPDQATVDEKCVAFRGAGDGGWGPIPSFTPEPPIPHHWLRQRLLVFTVDRELSDGNSQCPAEL